MKYDKTICQPIIIILISAWQHMPIEIEKSQRISQCCNHSLFQQQQLFVDQLAIGIFVRVFGRWTSLKVFPWLIFACSNRHFKNQLQVPSLGHNSGIAKLAPKFSHRWLIAISRKRAEREQQQQQLTFTEAISDYDAQKERTGEWQKWPSLVSTA